MPQSPANVLHVDLYTEECGPGSPVYDAWAIEDDQTGYTTVEDGATPVKPALGKTPALQELSHQCAAGFRTPGGRPSSNELWRFRIRGCQDCWAALFFIALLVATLLWGLAQLWQLELSQQDLLYIASGGLATTAGSGDSGDVVRGIAALRAGVMALRQSGAAPLDTSAGGTTLLPLLGACAVVAVVAIAAAYVGLLCIATMPRPLIFAQAFLSATLFAFCGATAVVAGQPIAGVLLLFSMFLPLAWLYLCSDRIPFAQAMLAAASRVLQRHRALMFLPLLYATVLCGLIALLACALLPELLRGAAGQPPRSLTDVAYPWFTLLSLFWTVNVVTAVAHATVAGVMATWYFAGDEYMPSYPVRSSFHRAMTTSFGSLCFGSLLSSLVGLLRFVAETIASGSHDGSGGSFLSSVMACFLRLMEDLVQYFNQYAFVHVAVYGCSYLEAAKKTWALTQQQPLSLFSAVFNDCLVAQVLQMMSLITASVVAVVVGLLAWSLPAAVTVFFLSLAVNAAVFAPIQSCVVTLFVCFAEVPAGLQISFPELFYALLDADHGVTTARNPYASSYGTV